MHDECACRTIDVWGKSYAIIIIISVQCMNENVRGARSQSEYYDNRTPAK